MSVRPLPVLVALLLLPVAEVHASRVSQSGTQMLLVADPGERNEVAFPGLDVVEDQAGATPGFGGCTQQSRTRVACSAVREVSAMLGDGDDGFAAPAALPVQAEGGPGADTLGGGSAADRLTGGPGRDAVRAGDGDDRVEADDGEADTVDCGGGADSAAVDAIDTVSGCETLTVDGADPGAPRPSTFDELPPCPESPDLGLLHQVELTGDLLPVTSIPASRRYQLQWGHQPPSEARLTVRAPAYLFEHYRSTGVRSLKPRAGARAALVTSGAAPLELRIEWVPDDARCRATRDVSVPVRSPCSAQLRRPASFATSSPFGVGRGPNALGIAGLRLSFGGCEGRWDEAVFDVRAYATRGTRTPRPRGRAARLRSYEDLALSPAPGGEVDSGVQARQAGPASRSRLVALGLGDFMEDQVAGRIGSVVVRPRPPGAPPSAPQRGRAMSLLLVAYDRRGRPVGPRWLVRIRPVGRLRRQTPRAFAMTVTRSGG